jgi:hypothetical protein
MLEGKKVCFFWQSGRLLAIKVTPKPQLIIVLFFIQTIHQNCGKSVQRMPATLLDKLQLWCGWPTVDNVVPF